MNILRGAAGILTAGVVLSACSAGGFDAAKTAPQNARLPFLSVRPPVAQLTRLRKRISPMHKVANDLIFVSDIGNDTVDVFTMPSLTFQTQLTNFNEPQGECGARNGNVWITNTNNPNALILYTHAGKYVESMGDYNEHPVACAIDQSTGDLAVSSFYAGNGSEAGDVAIYKGGSGSPTSVTCSGMYSYYFIAFGPKRTLYVDGVTSGGSFELCGGNEESLSPLNVSGATIYFPGFLQWYGPGKYLAAGDQLCNNSNAACVYQLSISGSTATSKGTTNLDRSDGTNVCDLTAAVFVGKSHLVGTDDEWCNDNREAAVWEWDWPAGGTPVSGNDSELVIPEGLALSK